MRFPCLALPAWKDWNENLVMGIGMVVGLTIGWAVDQYQRALMSRLVVAQAEQWLREEAAQ